MTTGMEFGLLGPLVVRRSGVVVPVQMGKQRVLLAALLLNAGRVVPVDELTEVIWGSRPPPSARVTLQNYVKRLRQAFADTDRARIGTQPGGYAICVQAGELDVTQFVALRESAQESAWAGSWDRVRLAKGCPRFGGAASRGRYPSPACLPRLPLLHRPLRTGRPRRRWRSARPPR